MLTRDKDFKCVCNYTAFKRRHNKIWARQSLISGSISIAPVLLSESVRRDGHLGKVIHPILTPTHQIFEVYLFQMKSSLRLRMSQT